MARKALETRKKENTDAIDNVNISDVIKELDKQIDAKVDDLTQSIFEKVDERIEYKIDKFLKSEEKKIVRKNRFKIIRLNLIILILLGIVGYFGYCLYQVDYFHIRTKVVEKPSEGNKVEEIESSDEEKPKENEEIDKNSLIEEYSYLINNLLIQDKTIFDLFNSNVTASTMSSELKMKIAYKNLDQSLIKIQDSVMSFSASDLNVAYQKIFGNNSNLASSNFSYNNTKFMFYNDMYIGLQETEEKIDYLHKISDISVEDSKISIEVIFTKLSTNGEILNDKNEVIISEYNGEDLVEYKEQLPVYKVTFENNGSEYFFSSIEKNRVNLY